MRKLFIALLALVAMAGTANAVNLTFKFDVMSSGNSMYACNAGLKHENYSTRVCYERDNITRSCNPSVCVQGQACNCVCTGGKIPGWYDSSAGEVRLDHFSAEYRDWADNGELGKNKKQFADNAGYTSFKQIFDTNREAYNKEISKLVFKLGSERYGAEYFVDICFRATQINYPNNVGLTWDVKNAVTVTDIGSSQNGSSSFDVEGNQGTVWYKGQTYQNLSGLKVGAHVYCKDKNNRPVINKTFSYSTFSNGQLKKFLDQDTTADLRGCKVRYFFKETNRDGLQSIRKWKKQQARICTYTSINEDM